MKPLTSAATSRTQRQDAAPTYLLQIDFTAPSAKTLYLSDDNRNVLGVTYLAMVKNWGTLEEALNNLDVDGKPSTAEITLFNAAPIEGKARISDLILTPLNTAGTYEWAFAKVTVTQLFEGLSTSDAVRLGVFYLEDPTDIGEGEMTVRMTDQSLVIETAMRNTVISKDLFPYCDSGEVGKNIPTAVGTLTQVPAKPLVAGNVTKVSGALSAAAVTIPVADTTGFDTTGTVIIDVELITYTGKTATSFTGATRGTNGSTATTHADQASVYDVRSSYIFVLGEHDATFKTKAISNIRVDGRAAVTSPSTTLDKTDLVTGKRFAVITFTPPNVQQFHAIPFGEFAVTGITGIVASVPAGGDANATKTLVLSVNSERLGGRHTRTGNWAITVGGASPASVSWAITRTVDGVATIIASAIGVDGSGTDAKDFVTTGDDVWRLDVHLPPATAGQATLNWNSYTIHADPGGTSSTGVACVGAVTCDVQGIADDGSGTISGTPSLLLENPADVTKYVLRQLFSVTDFGSTWAASRTLLTAAAHKWAALLTYATFSSLRRKLGEQARSVLYVEAGNWEYKFLDSSPVAQLTLDYAREVWNGMPARVSRTTRTDVHNSLTVSSQLNYSTSDYARAKLFEDLTQPGFTSRFADTLNLDLVQDATTADALGNYWLGWRKRQRFAVELVAWWNLLAVDKVDYIAIDNHPVLEAHGGTSIIFRIVGKSYLTGDENPGRIRLRLVEAGVYDNPPFAQSDMITRRQILTAWERDMRLPQPRRVFKV